MVVALKFDFIFETFAPGQRSQDSNQGNHQRQRGNETQSGWNKIKYLRLLKTEKYKAFWKIKPNTFKK